MQVAELEKGGGDSGQMNQQVRELTDRIQQLERGNRTKEEVGSIILFVVVLLTTCCECSL